MLLDNHQQLRHTFFEFYIYQVNKLSKQDFQKQLFHTFLELYTHRIKYEKYSLELYDTFLESYSIQEQIVL